MPEEPQHDPNVPNPDEPWCPKCEVHTKYTLTDFLHHGTSKYNVCNECGEKIWAPNNCPETLRLILSIISAGFIILGLLIAIYGRGDILILGYGFIIIGPLLYAQTMKHEIKPIKKNKKKWLAWVRERGYTGD